MLCLCIIVFFLLVTAVNFEHVNREDKGGVTASERYVVLYFSVP